MISVEKALKTVLKNIKQLNSETVKLEISLGRVLAEDIYASMNIPSFDNSAMDGYALKARDTRLGNKTVRKRLKVLEDLKAGNISKKILKNNQAIRIMTGASIPKGADAVIMVEATKAEDGYVDIFKEVRPGENIRRSAEDIRKGEKVIRKGTLLKSAHAGILASLGTAHVKVARTPKVAVLATGDELADVYEKLKPGKLYSSNTYSLCGQVRSCGAVPENLGIAKDSPRILASRIEKGLKTCDMILTSGGVSVGDYDLVKSVLTDMGMDIKFWQVAMRPGKPLVFGKINGVPVFGLPGNPVSSMVSFEVFVRPAIMKMLGREGGDRTEVSAILEEAVDKRKGFRYFLRASTRWENGIYMTRTTGAQGSAILKSMALANSLIILAEEEGRVEKGRRVSVRLL